MRGRILFVSSCLLFLPALTDACTLDPKYINQTTVVDGDFQVTFAADRFTAALGTPVSFILAIQYSGSAPKSFSSDVWPMNGFVMFHEGCTATAQPNCMDESMYIDPAFVYYFGGTVTFAPGQCHTWETHWSGLDWNDEVPAAGLYNVLGGLWLPAPTVSEYMRFFLPSGGAMISLALSAQAAVTVEPRTWTSVKLLYSESH